MIVLSTSVIVFMFVFTYLPQVAILTFVDGPLAIFNTVLLVLSEASAIVMFIAQGWWIDEAVEEVFDAVLIGKDCSTLVAQGREVKKGGGDIMGKLGKKFSVKGWREGVFKRVVRYIVMLPLNAIPVVGTVIFLVLQGMW